MHTLWKWQCVCVWLWVVCSWVTGLVISNERLYALMMMVSSNTPNTWPSNISFPRRMSTGKVLMTRPRNVRLPSCGFVSPEDSADNAPTCKHTYTYTELDIHKPHIQTDRWTKLTQWNSNLDLTNCTIQLTNSISNFLSYACHLS